jgi:malic enzyme
VHAATGGRALVATGSPFPDITQCNNVYVFPGIGLGLVSARARRAPSEVFLDAARTLGAMASDEDLARGRLLPPLTEIREVSLRIARAVAGEHTEIEQWVPEYLPYRRAPGAQG